jgi:DNA polymerase III subunit beta
MIKGEVTVAGAPFVAAIKWTARFLSSKPSVPIQGGLLLDATDGRLSILGYNESITARAAVEYKTDGSGQVVVSGRLLAALAGTFPNKPVTLASVTDQTVAISVGSWKGTLPTMNAADFASPPPAPEAIGTLRGDDLARMIREVTTARSDSDKALLRWHLMTLDFTGTEATGTATDSYRAARSVVEYSGKPGRALLHSATVLEVGEAFAGPDEVAVALSDSSIGFASPTRVVILRQVADADYPYEQIQGLFKTQHPAHARVTIADLHAPLKRAELVRDKQGPINVTFGKNMIRLSADSIESSQQGIEEIEADYDDGEQSLRFNPGYFAEALASAPGDEVDIAIQPGKITGVVVTVPGNDEWRHLLMPIRK